MISSSIYQSLNKIRNSEYQLIRSHLVKLVEFQTYSTLSIVNNIKILKFYSLFFLVSFYLVKKLFLIGSKWVQFQTFIGQNPSVQKESHMNEKSTYQKQPTKQSQPYHEFPNILIHNGCMIIKIVVY